MFDKFLQPLHLQWGDTVVQTFTPEDAEALCELGCAPGVVTHLRDAALSTPEGFRTHWLEKALRQVAEQRRALFTVHHQGQLAGSSSFYEWDQSANLIAMGYTWLHSNYWGSAVNTTVKYLLLSYLFAQCDITTVRFYVDNENPRSLRALAKLGITEEILWPHHLQRADGSWRDTVVRRVTLASWPTVREILLARMN